ncbi:RNA polymerase sigma factor [Paenibacillus antibioticophila]|uniref:RNA polymerase sigma factor n=1 Tax=Paenibacillus antibioticophila TaxID=1274374 RepID=UPI0005C82165|nr:sigma-70 family RNA polymerase sigma factor [Paenibacillus antibioticophila]
MEIDELIELVELHGKAIYGFCYNLTRNKEDADDLYQDTFLKAAELRHKMDMSGNPKAFLISIAIRLHRNSRRKLAWRRKIAHPIQLDEAGGYYPGSLACNENPEDALLSQELRTMIQKAADQLDDKLKLPLIMYYAVDMTIEEIASTLSIPGGTVKSRLHKARRIMRNVVGDDSI